MTIATKQQKWASTQYFTVHIKPSSIDTASLAWLLQNMLWEKAKGDETLEQELRTEGSDLHTLDALLEKAIARF